MKAVAFYFVAWCACVGLVVHVVAVLYYVDRAIRRFRHRTICGKRNNA